MREKFKELAGYRETYLVGDGGTIKTKDREGARGKHVNGHTLAQHENSNGYLRVNMHLKGEKKSKGYLVHRLVAKEYIPKIEGKAFVNHKDGNKHNNSKDNLEWCTKKRK